VGATSQGDVLVELVAIDKHFGEGATRVDALRGVSLQVAAGQVVGLRGPSGSGKTTVLNIIGCILEPSAGRLMLEGQEVYDGRWLRTDCAACAWKRSVSSFSIIICCRS